jgi:hypothetical protein
MFTEVYSAKSGGGDKEGIVGIRERERERERGRERERER